MIKTIYHYIILVVLVFLIQSCSVSLVLDTNETQEHRSSEPNEYIVSNYELDNTLWVIHPSRVQCQTIYYANLKSAMDFLVENSVPVFHARKVGNPYNCKCGELSPLYFAARIANKDRQKANNLGWQIPTQYELKLLNLD